MTSGALSTPSRAEFDALPDQYASTIIPEQRYGYLRQITHHVTDQVVLLGLFYGMDVTVYTRLQEVHGKWERTIQTWNMRQWELKG